VFQAGALGKRRDEDLRRGVNYLRQPEMRLARKSIENAAFANSALRLDIFSGEFTEFFTSLLAE
jgi:hypothetical protein